MAGTTECKPGQRAIRRAGSARLREMGFAAGSMGPNVEAACRFVEATRQHAAIGSLTDLEKILSGAAGTTVVPDGDTEFVLDDRSAD